MNKHASMNRIFRLVWSDVLGAWIAVAESARGRGKAASRKRIAALTAAALMAAAPPGALLAAPTGGQVVSGSGNVAHAGNTTNITQNSQHLSMLWQSFNIAGNETVNFLQPNASAIAVNRILDTNGTQILGNLNANGQVFLINPNGILFGAGAQVNVGGLVASTLDLDDASLNSNARIFRGNGTGSVINQGNLKAADGGYIALLGNTVSNQGVISARLGTVALGAGSAATLNFAGGTLAGLQIDQSTLNNLAENKQLIQADGGRVYMSAGARDAVLASVVNNSGVIEARTVEEKEGLVLLLSGMTAGTTNVDGRIDASAPADLNPQGGKGGFVETSGAQVKVADTARISTLAASGEHGTWLIDPTDYNVAASGGDITGAALSANLELGNVAILTPTATNGNGDVNIRDAINWSANTTLNVTAIRNVNVSATITGTAGGLNLSSTGNSFSAGNINVSAGINVSSLNLTANALLGEINLTAPITATTMSVTDRVGGFGVVRLNGDITAGTLNITINNTATNTATGNINVGTFNLTKGYIEQVATTQPTFSATDFRINTTNGAAAFLRAAGGSGSTADPYLITDIYGLQGLGNHLKTMGKSYSLANNIDASGTVNWNGGAGFVPLGVAVGMNVASYSGTFDGRGYTISNLYINRPTQTYVGLFGATYIGAVVKNLNMSGSNITGGQNVGGILGLGMGTFSNLTSTGTIVGGGTVGYVGGIVGLLGESYGTGTLSNSFSYGTVSSVNSGNIGGLVGYINTNSSVSDSGSGATVSGKQQVGGLAGSANGTILNSSATGGVSGSSATTGHSIGGLAGSMTGSSARITNSFATGNVSAGTGFSTLGGLVGAIGSGSQVSGSYALGNVTNLGTSATGGLAGTNSGTISGSFSTGNVTGQQYTGGLVGQNNAQITNAYATGSVTGTTGVGALVGYNAGTSAIVTNAYATGLVSGTSAYGLIGERYLNQGQVINSYWDTTTTGKVNSPWGGTGLTTAQAKTQASFNSWDFGGVWVMYDGYTYPLLRSFMTALNVTAGNISKVYDGQVYNGAGLVYSLPQADVNLSRIYFGSGLAGSRNAGTYALDSGSMYSDQFGYILTVTGSGSLTVTPRQLSLNAVSDTKTYNGNAASSGVVGISGLVAGDSISGLAQSFDEKNAGSRTLNVNSGYTIADGNNGNNYAVTTNTATGTIDKANLTVSGITAGDKVYDGTTSAAVGTGTVSYTGLVSGDNINITATGSFDNKNVGSGKTVNLTSTYGGLDAGNYNITSQASTTASVSQRTLNLDAVTDTKTYNGTVDSSGSVNVTGLQTGDNISGLIQQFDTKNAGTRNLNVTGYTVDDGNGGANYNVVTSSATGTINQAALTVSGIAAGDKVYDGTTTATVGTGAVSYTGLIGGDNINITATGSFDNRNVGSGKTVNLTSTYGGTDAGNYTITSQATTTASVSQRTLNLDAVTDTKTYDGNVSSGVNVNVTGLQTGDNISGLIQQFDTKNAGTRNLNVTGYTVNDGNGGANYNIVSTSATGTINQAALTVSGITAGDKTYDGSTGATVNVGGVNYAGLVAGDSINITATGSFDNRNAGSGKTVNLTSTYGGTDAGNYAITGQATTTASVAQRTLNLDAVTDTKTYDGNVNSGVNVNVTGLQGGDNISGLIQQFDTKNAGTRSLNVTGYTVNDGNGGANYNVVTGSATGTINQATLMVSGITAGDKVYDGTTGATVNAGAVNYAGLVAGDSINITASGSFDNRNVGSGKTVNLTSTYGGTDVGNYSITSQASTTASVSQRTLNLDAVTDTKTYDGNFNSSGTVVVGGLQSGDNISGLVQQFDTKNAGTRNLNVTGYTVNDGNGGANYNVVTSSATGTINQAALTVSGITAGDKVYDGTTTATIGTGGVSYTGLIGGDSINITATGSFDNKNVGTGKTVNLTSTYGGADAGNYTITSQSTTTASVSQRTLNLDAVTDTKTYDGNVNSSGAVAVGGLQSGDNISGLVQQFDTKNAGTRSLNVTGYTVNDGNGGANYNIVASSATGTITQAALTVNGITAGDKVYDGTTGATVNTGAVNYAGLIAGDNINITATGSFDNRNAGTGKTVNLTSTYGGTDVGNYTITGQATTTANVSQRTLNLDAVTDTKTYDGNVNSSGTVVVGGLQTGDSINGLVQQFDTKNAGARNLNVTGYTVNDGNGGANYNILASSATGTINQAALTVSGITAGNKTYDSTDTATVATGGVSYTGLIAGDNINITATGSFDNKNAGTGKTVNLTSTYGGTDAGNYAITSQATTTADISRANLTISGITAADKTYDATTGATVNTGSAQYTGLFAGDNVGLGATGSFADKNAGTGKTVNLTSTYGGVDADNYNITSQTTATADIARANLTVSGLTGVDRSYNATTNAAINTAGASFAGLLGSDQVNVTVTGQFNDANVGTGKTVTITSSYGGADAGNYNITDQTGTTASISQATLVYVASPATFLPGTLLTGLTGSVNGFFGTDTLLNSTTGTLAWTTPANAGSAAGQYAILGSGLASGNYAFVQGSGNATALTIGNAPVITNPGVNPNVPNPNPIGSGNTGPASTLAQSGGGDGNNFSAPPPPPTEEENKKTLIIGGSAASLDIIDGGVRLPGNTALAGK